MPHTLDFHNFRVAEKLIYHAVIADANSIHALGTSQFLRAVRERLLSELGHFSYDTRYCLAWESGADLSSWTSATED